MLVCGVSILFSIKYVLGKEFKNVVTTVNMVESRSNNFFIFTIISNEVYRLVRRVLFSLQ